MKLSPTALLILSMFGSFAIILTAMIVFFRPKPARRPPDRGRARMETPAADTAGLDSATAAALSSQAAPDTGRASAGATDGTPRPRPAPRRTPPGAASALERQLQKELRQEQKEMALLRTEMERRLREQAARQNRALARLAEECEKLEPGEAVQILQKLDDASIAEVLRRIGREKALKIAALLKRLGREKAIPTLK